MEEPVFIKCEPGYVSGTSELNNADHDVKQPTEKKMDVKTEPEDVFCKPFIKEEIEIQDMKIETYDEENNSSAVSLNNNFNLLLIMIMRSKTFSASHSDEYPGIPGKKRHTSITILL
ncbi:uncharacterized protein [Anabrus simplex]|uniref:uncharacterized protein isoform X2 n=1 Tax=Anabrus simplex TaxID=316456 RepID=UPI0035A3BC05